MSKRQNFCNTHLVLLRLGLSEVAQNLHSGWERPYTDTRCDTSGSTEIFTPTDRGRP